MRVPALVLLMSLVGCRESQTTTQVTGSSSSSAPEPSTVESSFVSRETTAPTASNIKPPSGDIRGCELAAHAERFIEFAQLFARCWDTKDVKRIEPLVVEQDFWMIYNIGVADDAYHFTRLSEAWEDPCCDGFGFGYLRATEFDCSPTWAAAPEFPNCSEEDAHTCSFGVVRLDLLRRLNRRIEDTERGDRKSKLTRLRGRALVAQRRVTHFVTDKSRGGMFYFGRIAGRWKLVAVSTADCSA